MVHHCCALPHHGAKVLRVVYHMVHNQQQHANALSHAHVQLGPGDLKVVLNAVDRDAFTGTGGTRCWCTRHAVCTAHTAVQAAYCTDNSEGHPSNGACCASKAVVLPLWGHCAPYHKHVCIGA